MLKYKPIFNLHTEYQYLDRLRKWPFDVYTTTENNFNLLKFYNPFLNDRIGVFNRLNIEDGRDATQILYNSLGDSSAPGNSMRSLKRRVEKKFTHIIDDYGMKDIRISNPVSAASSNNRNINSNSKSFAPPPKQTAPRPPPYHFSDPTRCVNNNNNNDVSGPSNFNNFAFPINNTATTTNLQMDDLETNDGDVNDPLEMEEKIDGVRVLRDAARRMGDSIKAIFPFMTPKEVFKALTFYDNKDSRAGLVLGIQDSYMLEYVDPTSKRRTSPRDEEMIENMTREDVEWINDLLNLLPLLTSETNGLFRSDLFNYLDGIFIVRPNPDSTFTPFQISLRVTESVVILVHPNADFLKVRNIGGSEDLFRPTVHTQSLEFPENSTLSEKIKMIFDTAPV